MPVLAVAPGEDKYFTHTKVTFSYEHDSRPKPLLGIHVTPVSFTKQTPHCLKPNQTPRSNRFFYNAFGRPTNLLASSPKHRRRSFANESERLLRHWRILLAVALYLWIASAALFFGHRIHYHGDMATATPPGCLLCVIVSRRIGCGVEMRLTACITGGFLAHFE